MTQMELPGKSCPSGSLFVSVTSILDVHLLVDLKLVSASSTLGLLGDSQTLGCPVSSMPAQFFVVRSIQHEPVRPLSFG